MAVLLCCWMCCSNCLMRAAFSLLSLLRRCTREYRAVAVAFGLDEEDEAEEEEVGAFRGLVWRGEDTELERGVALVDGLPLCCMEALRPFKGGAMGR